MSNETLITYFGTNCLLFTKADSALMVDPHFTRPRLRSLLGKIAPDTGKIRIGLAKAGVSSLDGVLLTHTHYDHALDAVETARQTDAVLYGSTSAGMLAAGEGLDPSQIHVVPPDQGAKIVDFRVKFLPSQHIQFPVPFRWFMSDDEAIRQPLSSPAWFWQYRCGQAYGILIDKTLVFGSANFIVGAYAGLDVDTIVLGIGGVGLKPSAYLDGLYKQVVLSTGANRVLVSHWDNFFRPIGDGLRPLGRARHTFDRLVQLGAKNGQDVRLLEYGLPVRAHS
jgi:hypothetical protein